MSLFWMYIDQEGEKQGPFETSKMAAWTKAGFFVADTKVQVQGEGDFVSLAMHPLCAFKELVPGYQPPLPSATEHAPSMQEKQATTTQGEGKEQEEEGQDLIEAKEKEREEEVANKWFYLDDDGKPQGPFEDDDMREWFGADYFDDTTKIKLAGEEMQAALQDAAQFVAAGDFPGGASFLKPKKKKKAKRVRQPKVKWMYVDDNNKEQGPWSERQMTHWYRKGYFTGALDGVLLKQVSPPEKAHSNYKPFRRFLSPPSFVMPPHPPNLHMRLMPAPRSMQMFRPQMLGNVQARVTPPPPQPALVEPRWCYLDSQGKEQGPFSSQKMRQWYAAGHLSLQVKVRTEQESSETFAPIGTRPGGCCFTAPPKRVEVTADPSAALLQSLDAIDAQATSAAPSAPANGPTPNAPHVLLNQPAHMLPQGNPQMMALHRQQQFQQQMHMQQVQRQQMQQNQAQHIYTAVANFNKSSGRFSGAVGEQSHWEKKGLSEDRAGRQMAHYFDFDSWQDQQNARMAKKRRKLARH